jgi:hypothetical protein
MSEAADERRHRRYADRLVDPGEWAHHPADFGVFQRKITRE